MACRGNPLLTRRFLHGYGTSVKVWFEGELDYRNWVMDFGMAKRAKGTIDGKNLKDWFKWLLDHTFIVAEDDPYKEHFLKMDKDGIAQVRVIPEVGAERFAEYIYSKLAPLIESETQGRIKICKVEFREHEKNSAIFIPE